MDLKKIKEERMKKLALLVVVAFAMGMIACKPATKAPEAAATPPPAPTAPVVPAPVTPPPPPAQPGQ